MEGGGQVAGKRTRRCRRTCRDVGLNLAIKRVEYGQGQSAVSHTQEEAYPERGVAQPVEFPFPGSLTSTFLG